jgi:uncharacterized protein YgiM (DUF1202 family)
VGIPSRHGLAAPTGTSKTVSRSMGLASVLCLAAVLPTGWADEMAYVVQESATPCLVLRDLPQSDSDRLDCLAPGTKVTAIDSKPYWREVRLEGGREGWVAKKFLELAAAVPEAQPPFPANPNAWLEVHFVFALLPARVSMLAKEVT